MRTSLLLLIILFTSILIPAHAQLSHGGKPLPFSKNLLRASGSNSTNGLYIDMPSFDIKQILQEDSIEQSFGELRALRFAKKFYTDITPDNSGIHFTTPDGAKVWRVGIRSQGAYSLNILFSTFHLPDGASLFLYNPDQTKILGAFTEKNNSEDNILPLSPVQGDELIIEYQEPANAAFPGKLRISEVNHDYTDIFKVRPGTPSDNGGCHQDPVCRDDLDKETQSVCLIILNGTLKCSGSMINNTAQDGIPYLLTSCHCLDKTGTAKSREEVASTIVVFFNYQSPACNTGIRGTEEMSMVSPVLRAADKELDMALLELNQIPPIDFRPYYAGWDLTPTPPAPYIGIHQPNGGIKKVAQSNQSLSIVTNRYLDGITFKELWVTNGWNIGTTEGGSSGSPFFDGQMRLIGALTGGGSTCAYQNKNDYYWTLKTAWDYYSEPNKQLKAWLDPLNSGATSLDGFNPYKSDSCLRISNVQRNESYTNYQLNAPESGYLFGYNTLQTDEYADKFELSQKAYLYGVSLVTPVLSSPDADKKITVKVYNESQPETAIISKSFLPQYEDYTSSSNSFTEKNKPFNYNSESYLKFDVPVEVNNNFYVSYQLDYSVQSPFYVYSAVSKASRVNTAYYKNNNSWIPASSHVNNPVNTSLWINPVIKYRSESSIHKVEGYGKNARLYKDSNAYFHIETDTPLNAVIEIYTLSGRKANTFDYSGNESSFSLQHLPKGIYIFKLQTSAGEVILREKIAN